MATVSQYAYQMWLLICIVNQLHQVAQDIPCGGIPPGMTVSQLATIGLLSFSEQEDVYQRDIEAFFRLRRSSVSSQLDTLERKGLIRRVPVPHDARLKKVVLTEEGLKISDAILGLLGKINDRLVQGLTAEEVDQLNGLLRKVEQNLSHTKP